MERETHQLALRGERRSLQVQNEGQGKTMVRVDVDTTSDRDVVRTILYLVTSQD